MWILRAFLDSVWAHCKTFIVKDLLIAMPKVGTFVLLNSFGILFSLGNYKQRIHKEGQGSFRQESECLKQTWWMNWSLPPAPFDFPVYFREQRARREPGWHRLRSLPLRQWDRRWGWDPDHTAVDAAVDFKVLWSGRPFLAPPSHLLKMNQERASPSAAGYRVQRACWYPTALPGPWGPPTPSSPASPKPLLCLPAEPALPRPC